ncbi:hypothetical protein [Pseudomonas sp. Xaverov 259]|uniref:hypothetical protein n=1 Tax=Pseudomonas sp. Xaverov 259 TaxID=2666086 RepID=UPI001C5B9E0D|nr:hypothetical protein [Pseudomonas sp. Xaverov 259]
MRLTHRYRRQASSHIYVKPPEVTYTNIPNEAGDGEVTKLEILVKPDQADGVYSPAE